MAWERNFEARVLQIRDEELRYQKLTYTVQVRIFIYLQSDFTDSDGTDAVDSHGVCIARTSRGLNK